MNASFLSHADAAIRNRNTILHYIKQNSPVSRTGIWENINISRASVTQIINRLQNSGLISEVGHGASTGGRKPLYLTFNGDKIKFISFDWILKTITVMTLGEKVLYEKKLDLKPQISPEEFADTIIASINEITRKSGCKKDELANLILSLPGTIDSVQKKVIYSVELSWQNIHIPSLFSGKFDGDIFIERTSNILALCGAENPKLSPYSHFQLFILGESGIGVSTVIHGGIQHGAQCMHGELGHIKLNNKTKCSCGQKGCLEAIVNELFEKSNHQLTDEILDYLAIGISTSINIFDTDILLMGSYIDMMNSKQKEYLIEAIKQRVTASEMRTLKIKFSDDRSRLSQRGMCAFMFDKLFPID
ncbi:MAG: ROK family transcriptional regulator [Ruminococcaceae bacterium]|nr:ROK family transcriptional regulator [Oscillospiraceae bacterium]